MTTTATTELNAIAERVLLRVVLRRWLALLSATWPWALAFLVAAVAGHWFMSMSPWLSVGIALLWLAGAAVWTWKKRPPLYSALALWDSVAGRSEAVAAAWFFAQQPQVTATEQQHIAAQCATATEGVGSLSQQLPLVFTRGPWLALAMVLLAFVSPFTPRAALPDEPLTEAMRDVAKSEAQKLADTDIQKAKLKNLSAEEKAKFDELQQHMQQTAKDLANSDSKSAREVLSELERRANEAEKLAAQLAANKDAWASEALIEQLRKHADTADLGDSVANKDAASAANAAKALAEQLRAPDLSAEAKTRLTDTLSEVAKKSEDDDHQRLVGSHVLTANEKLQSDNAKSAGEEFQRLSETLANQAQRDKAKEQLEQLAQQLRDSGSRIAGQQNGAMQQMQAAGQQAKQGTMQSLKQTPQGLSQQQQMQTPGAGQQQTSQVLKQSSNPSDSPNQGQQQQQLQMAQQQPGQNQQSDDKTSSGKPMLLAPDPSKKPDEQPSALILSQSDSTNADGKATMIPGSGLQAGQGTAKLDGDKTRSTTAKDSSMVNAQGNSLGPSRTRSVEGGIRSESATRSSHTNPADFVRQEEAALNDSALPPARREQVRRYFNELRKRFEPKQE